MESGSMGNTAMLQLQEVKENLAKAQEELAREKEIALDTQTKAQQEVDHVRASMQQLQQDLRNSQLRVEDRIDEEKRIANALREQLKHVQWQSEQGKRETDSLRKQALERQNIDSEDFVLSMPSSPMGKSKTSPRPASPASHGDSIKRKTSVPINEPPPTPSPMSSKVLQQRVKQVSFFLRRREMVPVIVYICILHMILLSQYTNCGPLVDK